MRAKEKKILEMLGYKMKSSRNQKEEHPPWRRRLEATIIATLRLAF